ncbi:uncharacterized protein MELLADRAFT_69441 [Melampsora larici-populina 98AG31]|uniref:Uncharacterized protein n=1 Tax=Melampsora larici-populina (strain 98AG31 / pathotype 3-4-7) TaxID=747676 RepID=F4SAS0_MELLP|nr:uncharacterized protein MELLADRAFT_69441 [Melampsora larici-populina 98AG31]EGF98265.1 hypothetical protein MELLADRAFT_69441 [Melampsora larici-populina 98AG31]
MDEAIAQAEAKAAKLTLTGMRAAATGQQSGPRIATPCRAWTLPQEIANPVDNLDGDPFDGKPIQGEEGQDERAPQSGSPDNIDALEVIQALLIPLDEDNNASWRLDQHGQQEEGKGKRRALSSACSPSPNFKSGDEAQLLPNYEQPPRNPNDRVEWLFAKGRRAEAIALLDHWHLHSNDNLVRDDRTGLVAGGSGLPGTMPYALITKDLTNNKKSLDNLALAKRIWRPEHRVRRPTPARPHTVQNRVVVSKNSVRPDRRDSHVQDDGY